MFTSKTSAPTPPRSSRVRFAACLALVMLLAPSAWPFGGRVSAADPQQLDLRVLVLDDNENVTVEALQNQMTVEGIPFTRIDLDQVGRQAITAQFLASGTHGHFQAVIVPTYQLPGLTDGERTALTTYESTFGVRQVDGVDYPAAAIGLQTPPPTAIQMSDLTNTVTAAGLVNGFQYLVGPVPATVGSFGTLGVPLASLPSGTSYTTLVQGSGTAGTGSLVGVYASNGRELMVISVAMSEFQLHFRYLGHGILTWATRGVHLGYYRNRLTVHVDDAFAADAQWDTTLNCTPGEDPDSPTCPAAAGVDARMTADDVAYAAAWQLANDYTFTLAFNGFYADPVADPLTQAFQANKSAFRWLNHGLSHVNQGCVETAIPVVPFVCQTDPVTLVKWVDTQTISNEITDNIAVGAALGLAFDHGEYLSGGHTGLIRSPQEPSDNPNFATALTANQITAVGADASHTEEANTRPIGSASTVPRHPTVLYYNAATIEREVDEYNFIYNTTLTTDQFENTIIANDAAFDLGFVLSNDPRPFYAHTANMTGDRTLYTLVGTILDRYHAVFNESAPLANLALTEAARDLRQQNAWAAGGMSATPNASASVQYGQSGQAGVVTIVNTGGAQVPVTAPAGTSVAGATLDSWGGELSGWVNPSASTTVTLPTAPAIATTGSASFVIGVPNTMTFSTTAAPAASIWLTGALPTGLTFGRDGVGAATLSGTAADGAVGEYPITITAWSGSGSTVLPLTLHVGVVPAFTSADHTSSMVGDPFTFEITTTGTPTPVLTSGAPPDGVTFTAHLDGTATLAGTSSVPGAYPITLTATNPVAAVNQTFTLTITGAAPAFTSAVSTSAKAKTAFSFNVAAVGTPTPTLSTASTLPAGVTFTPNGDGTAVLAGTTTKPGTYALVIRAQNPAGSTTQQFSLVVVPNPTGELTPLTPARILDTRTSTGGHRRTVAAAEKVDVQITGRGGVPSSGVAAVVMNVTVTGSTTGGYLTIWPAGARRPGTTSLSFAPRTTVANLVTVSLGTGGKVSIYNARGATHVIVDVVGYYANVDGALGGRFHAVAPSRLFDTRNGTGGVARTAVKPAGVLRFDVTGVNGVPATGVTAIIMNVTVTGSTTGGYLTVYPADVRRPGTSSINFTARSTVPNLVIVRVPKNGVVAFYNSAGSTHVVADVLGYFDGAKATEAGRFVGLPPTRVLDTRSSTPIGPASTRVAPITGRGGVPTTGAVAVVLNVTVFAPTTSGYHTVYPNQRCTVPRASNINFIRNQNIGNAVIVQLSTKSGCATTAGTLGFFNSSGRTHVVGDVFGYFTATGT